MEFLRKQLDALENGFYCDKYNPIKSYNLWFFVIPLEDQWLT